MRRNVNRSTLARQLAGWLPAPVEEPRQDLAERLGQWLNVADAIALESAHRALPAVARARPAARSHQGADALAELQRVRATLGRAIASDPARPTDAEDTDFAPQHQRYLEHQRRFDMSIEALRGHLRQTLAQASPRLAQLAALDATLDQMLGGREQKLLAGVPAFLKLRFDQLRQAHPADWPARFEPEFQQTLLAELELRLQPVIGMTEALGRATTGHGTGRVETA